MEYYLFNDIFLTLNLLKILSVSLFEKLGNIVINTLYAVHEDSRICSNNALLINRGTWNISSVDRNLLRWNSNEWYINNRVEEQPISYFNEHFEVRPVDVTSKDDITDWREYMISINAKRLKFTAKPPHPHGCYSIHHLHDTSLFLRKEFE